MFLIGLYSNDKIQDGKYLSEREKYARKFIMQTLFNKSISEKINEICNLSSIFLSFRIVVVVAATPSLLLLFIIINILLLTKRVHNPLILIRLLKPRM